MQSATVRKYNPNHDEHTGQFTGDGTPTYYRGRDAQAIPGSPVRAAVAYFTATAEAAQAYAGEEGHVLAAHLDLKNPATEADVRRISEEHGIDLIDDGHPAAYLEQSPKLVAALQRAGFDGAIGRDSLPEDRGEITSYAVFSPKQVVPATIKLAKYSEDQPRDERGRWGDGGAQPFGTKIISDAEREQRARTPAQIASGIALDAAIKASVIQGTTNAAKILDFDMRRVTFEDGQPRSFSLNGKQLDIAGEYDEKTGHITMYAGTLASSEDAEGVMAHEIGHDIFAVGARDGIAPATAEKLRAEDGISQYSRDWWASEGNHVALTYNAQHETFAEVTRVVYESTRSLGSPWESADARKVGASWKALYTEYTSRYKVYQNR